MIKLNGKELVVKHFPDGTLSSKIHKEEVDIIDETPVIEWYYESDAELFVLDALVDQLRENGAEQISLSMVYIPHARMDRIHKENGDIFTLKTFAKLLNGMGFKAVETYEAHSSVSTGFINRIRNHDCEIFAKRALAKIASKNGIEVDDITLFFPDDGAMKRYAYSGMFSNKFVFGMKNRDWETGNIESLNAMGDTELVKDKHILIIDDISSRGGTFYLAAKALKELGAKSISLYVTHCENTILAGPVIGTDLLDRVYTTDSIFTERYNKLSKNKIVIVNSFRPSRKFIQRRRKVLC